MEIVVYRTSTHGVALVRIIECRSECAARSSLEMQDPKNRYFGTIAQICRAISSEIRHVSTIRKNLVNSNTSSTCPRNMMNVGLLTAEILASMGHPCKFQRLSRLGSVTAWHCSSGHQPNFVALNRGRHLYLAGWPSRWALAHISSCICIMCITVYCMHV